MLKKAKSNHGVFTGPLMLVLGCVSLMSMCGWILNWCLNALPIKQGTLLLGLVGIGLLILFWQAWRTYRYVNQLICYGQLPLPSGFETQVVEFGLDPDHIVLIQSPQPTALCFGFLRPGICISTGLLELLSRAQIKAALLHEDYHRQRFDPLRLLLAQAIAGALFFLPIVREWHAIFKIKLELDADHYAIQRTGKAAMAGALQCILSYGLAPASMPNVVTASLNANAARIAALLGERSPVQQVSRRSILSSTAILWVLCLILMG
ncbi:MAG: M56 family metallopeptidase [Anaerolineae bacterium]|nr:M56 family metallopeptidase [Anaerolineae bacterium]